MNPSGPALRDIHLPDAPGFWPPAPGWWALALLAMICGFFLLRGLLRLRRKRAWRRVLAAELAAIDARHPLPAEAAAHAAALSVLLRRLAVQRDAAAAGLMDESWLRFLDGDDPARPFSEGAGRILLNAPYRRRVDAQDAAALRELVQRSLTRWAQVRRV